MEDQFSRTKLIYGNEAVDSLKEKRVAVFGIGGVGGYVCEALVRTGIGHFFLVDNDVVAPSNINRQIIATTKTIGQYKVDVMAERIASINPDVEVKTLKAFILPENIDDIDFKSFDYVVDAIDTVKAKLSIIKKAIETNTPIISSMGTGNKTNPMGFMVTDINKTETDPLAKVIRRELRKIGIKHLKVIYSKETPREPTSIVKNETTNKVVPGSSPFVPSAAGLLIASEVVHDLMKNEN